MVVRRYTGTSVTRFRQYGEKKELGAEGISYSFSKSSRSFESFNPPHISYRGSYTTPQPSASISYALDLCFGSNLKVDGAFPRNISLYKVSAKLGVTFYWYAYLNLIQSK